MKKFMDALTFAFSSLKWWAKVAAFAPLVASGFHLYNHELTATVWAFLCFVLLLVANALAFSLRETAKRLKDLESVVRKDIEKEMDTLFEQLFPGRKGGAKWQETKDLSPEQLN